MDEELATLFLGVAQSWLGIAERERDPRYLNAALKLIGCAVLSGCAAGRGREARSAVASALAALDRTDAPIPSTLPPAPQSMPSRLPPLPGASEDRRIVVLAGAHEDKLCSALDRNQGLGGILPSAQKSKHLVYVILLAAAFQAFEDERRRVGFAFGRSSKLSGACGGSTGEHLQHLRRRVQEAAR
ncbi:hypothetical protein ABZ357_37285 [Streptomyces sp. NPDC005917]|uniref:hypothetical protein n=1 Tax=unclassified Streptomyces TaxID=2593676 RepID=UPI0033EC38DB